VVLVGAGIFLVADHVIERRFGADGAGGALGIVLGSVVDGVPESLIFGIQLAAGVPLSVAFLAAVFVSNIPRHSPRPQT
jgi:ZIP family zinc transporter